MKHVSFGKKRLTCERLSLFSVGVEKVWLQSPR
jgi:hypothetical protein